MSEPFEAKLTEDQVQQFQEQGFLSLPRITSDEEIARLRGIFERLFATGAGFEQGSQYDLIGTDDGTPPKLPQILGPSKLAPELLETAYRKNALAVARQLLGPEADFRFEHAIFKPAQYGAPTPWHQDEAHRKDTHLAYEQVSIWMPLQEAKVENGCMQYIGGTHRGGILPHRSPNNDTRIPGLECYEGFSPADATICPLPPGGATIHLGRTLHHAGPNRTDIPRYAYILAFATPARPAIEPGEFIWNREKQTAAQSRREQWENRGGVIGKTARRAGGILRKLVRR